MDNLSRSPGRHKFGLDKYIERRASEGRTVDNDEDVKAMVEYYQSIPIEKAKVESTENFRKNNMEYDLRSTQWICEKVRNSDRYAQNLYAAMCNRDFMRNDVMPILKEEIWHCSWRYAGGIIADMRQEGDYIDWYCSGIGEGIGNGDHDGSKGYVSESEVTDEIREDLFKLGWIVLDEE
jgi:hypothetical protein